MNMRWSLDELYTSFESPSFKNDAIKVNDLVNEIRVWSKDNLNTDYNAVGKIVHFLNAEIEFNHVFSKLMTYASLTSSVDARNEEALKTIDKLQVKYNELTEPSVSFEKWVSSLDNLEEIINSSDFLK